MHDFKIKYWLMRLLTQGSMVEVLGPESARQDMKRMLQEMLAK